MVDGSKLSLWRLVILQIRGNSSGGRLSATLGSRLQLSHQLLLIRGTQGISAYILQRARQKLSEKLTKLQNNFVYFAQKSCWRKGNIIHPDCLKILAKFPLQMAPVKHFNIFSGN